MLKLLREEYSKKINYFLDEVETKAKHSKTDGELIQSAAGLKVKNRAGFVYVIDELSKDPETGQIFVYLIPPGEKDPNIVQNKSNARLDDMKDQSVEDEYNKQDSEEYIYSSVNENPDMPNDKENEAGESNKKNNKKKTDQKVNNNDIIDPSDKAKFKKQQVININAKTNEPKMINGRYRITLQELERDYTL